MQDFVFSYGRASSRVSWPLLRLVPVGAIGVGIGLILATAVDLRALQRLTGSGRISGAVIDAQSQSPIRGAEVTASCPRATMVRRLKTDDDGAFAFADLPACDVTLTATYPGYVSGVFGQANPGIGIGRVLALGPDETIEKVRFPIAKAGAISGRVLTRFGDPAIGVRVEALRILGGGGKPIVVMGATCDDRGEFRVFSLPPGDYLLRALPSGPSAGEDYVVLGLGTATIDDLIQAQSRVFSTQRKRNQSEVGNAEVSPLAAIYYPGAAMITDAQRLHVGVSEQVLGLELRLQQLQTVDLVGTVTNGGRAIPSQTKVAIANAGLCCTETDVADDGTFSIRNVVPGDYVLQAWSSGGARLEAGRFVGDSIPLYWASSRVLVDRATTATLNLNPGIRVEGTVRASAGMFPFPPAGSASTPSVSLTLLRGDGGMPAIRVNALITPPGRFEFQGVPPGHYRLEASPGPFRLSLRNAMLNNRDVLDTGLDVPSFGVVSDISLVFSPNVTQVSGTIVGGPALASGGVLQVVIFSAEEIYWSTESRRIRVVSATEGGGFAFEGLPPGEYRIAAFSHVPLESPSDPAFLRQLSPTAVSLVVREGTPTTVSVIAR